MCLPALPSAYAASSPKRLLGQLEIDEQFSKALNLVGDGHFVFGTENKYLLPLRDVLKEAVNDQYDYIDDDLAKNAEWVAWAKRRLLLCITILKIRYFLKI